MNVAIVVQWMGKSPVNLIIFAQAMTVLGLPALAFVMLYLAFQKDLVDERRVPLWLKGVAVVGFVIVAGLAIRSAVALYLKLSLAGG